MNSTRWTDWLLIGFFLLCLVLSPEFTGQSKTKNSDNLIKSNLKESALKWDRIKDFPDKLREILRDNFGLRDVLVKLFSRVNVACGLNPRRTVILGTDNWLYLGANDAVNDVTGQRLFTSEELDLWKRYLNIKFHALRDIGIGYVFVVAPNKHSIHPEHLPMRYHSPTGYTRTDQWIEFMIRETDVPIVDLRQLLKQATTVMPIHKPTDTHWSDYGSALAHEAIMNSLRTQGLKRIVRHFSPEDFKMKIRPGGDLARMLSLKFFYRSRIPLIKPAKLKSARMLSKKTNTLFSRSEERFESPNKQDKLLLIGDSFIGSLQKFLTPYFHTTLKARVHNHQLRHLDPFVSYIQEFKPDYIVEVRVGRFLLDTIPEEPPAANLMGYPPWLKKYFTLAKQPLELKTLRK
ncbi:hypothetical protein K8T06_09830 [bacterium]|nr:hypothetical protein [bacterium]